MNLHTCCVQEQDDSNMTLADLLGTGGSLYDRRDKRSSRFVAADLTQMQASGCSHDIGDNALHDSQEMDSFQHG